VASAKQVNMLQLMARERGLRVPEKEELYPLSSSAVSNLREKFLSIDMTLTEVDPDLTPGMYMHNGLMYWVRQSADKKLYAGRVIGRNNYFYAPGVIYQLTAKQKIEGRS